MLREAFERNVLNLLSRFQDLQAPDGAITGSLDEAENILSRIKLGLQDIAHHYPDVSGIEPLCIDISSWQSNYLYTAPDFRITQQQWRPPAPGEISVIVAPIRTPNSAPPCGFYLEGLLLEGIQPSLSSQLNSAINPLRWTCNFANALSASRGYQNGQCVVVFAENIATDSKSTHQSFGLFLTERFPQLYSTYTVNICDSLISSSDLPLTHLSFTDLANLRCSWLAVHDAFHNVGEKPHRTNLHLKMRTLDAIADEIKADSAAFLAFQRSGARGMAGARMMLLDRLFRLTLDANSRSGVDARVGRAFFNLLWEEEAIRSHRSGLIRIDWYRVAGVLSDAYTGIVELEAFADDVVYSRQLARWLGYRLSIYPPQADDAFGQVVETRLSSYTGV